MFRILVVVTLMSSVARAAPLPFIEDDWPRARAEAQKTHKPIFVDSWAPWCHSCVFLRTHVLTDAALAKQAGRFVWLSIDTEKERNAPFLEAFPVEVWPTLMVIDPSGQQALLRWAGTATVPQLERLFDDGERAVGNVDALARADRAAAAGKPADAVQAYRAALKTAPESRRGRVTESLVLALTKAGDAQGCAETAQAQLPKLTGSSRANVAAAGLSCAVGAPATAPWRAASLAALQAAATEALATPDLLADDRSGVYEALVEAHSEAGDAAGAKALALKWLAFLEAEAAKAPTAEARAAFDPHRLSAAMAAGDPARAIAPLKASEKAFPRDYNPPARLAIAYRELGRYDEALATIGHALTLAYGPRRIRLYETRASIYEKKGDRAGARRAIEEAIAVARTMPAAQHGPEAAARLQKKLAQ